MMQGLKRSIVFSLATAVLLTVSSSRAADKESQLRADILKQVRDAESEAKLALIGTDGRMFLVSELRALSVGPFWGEAALRVSRATKSEYADPLPVIVDFHRQLQRAEVELLLVPVPAKGSIYPESIASRRFDLEVSKTEKPPRIDSAQLEFYRLLAEQKIAVLDLSTEFWQHRHDREGDVFCRTDSHWSGRGIELAAQAIAARYTDRDWMKEIHRTTFATRQIEAEFAGDLAQLVDEKKPAREKLKLTQVGIPSGGEFKPQPVDRDSPVLLMGDSHTLVFHDSTMYAQGAGLPDQLALRWGFGVDLIGVRGSGASATRVELLRRKDNLAGKKLVVWCFSFREFTESTTGWRMVPIIK